MTAKLNQIEVNGFRVPATTHDALIKIKSGLAKGLVHFDAYGCYEAKHGTRSVFSPVGYLLTFAQRKAIIALDGDEEHPWVVWSDEVLKAFGKRNIETMLAMTIDEACELEHVFDRCAKKANGHKMFLLYLNEELTKPNKKNPGLENK